MAAGILELADDVKKEDAASPVDEKACTLELIWLGKEGDVLELVWLGKAGGALELTSLGKEGGALELASP